MAATFVLAPLPNWICGRCANPDDFIETAGNAIVDFGRWFTGFLVTMGIGTSHLQQNTQGAFKSYSNVFLAVLPIVLASVGTIGVPAMLMSITGGALIYGTIITFSLFFQEQEDF